MYIHSEMEGEVRKWSKGYTFVRMHVRRVSEQVVEKCLGLMATISKMHILGNYCQSLE